MWIFKVKTDSIGNIDKRKVCIVVKGNEQFIRINFSKTFVLVICWSIICSIIAIAVHKNQHLQHLDVITAFLHGHLIDDVYMIILQGFPQVGQVLQIKMKPCVDSNKHLAPGILEQTVTSKPQVSNEAQKIPTSILALKTIYILCYSYTLMISS